MYALDYLQGVHNVDCMLLRVTYLKFVLLIYLKRLGPIGTTFLLFYFHIISICMFGLFTWNSFVTSLF